MTAMNKLSWRWTIKKLGSSYAIRKKKCCFKERVVSKSDILLHFGIRALCIGADTCSLASCQGVLMRGFRCMKKGTKFATHAWTSRPYVWSGRSRHGHVSANSLAQIASLEKSTLQNIKLHCHQHYEGQSHTISCPVRGFWFEIWSLETNYAYCFNK